MTKLIASLPALLLGVALAAGLTGCTRLDSEVVELDGREVEVVAAGEGAATVVFEAGLGDGWRRWDEVASAVAEQAHVFAYSRPGYGRSDATTAPRDPETIVEELRELLASQDEAPPYVLVGHSFGGTYMELFARSHPDEVAAAVLVEPRPAGFLDECERRSLDLCGMTRDQLDRSPDALVAEYDAFPDGAMEIEEAGGFGAYPVRVLTGTDPDGTSDERNALFMSMQGSIADEAEDGEQILFEDAGHYLQLERPDEVTAAILDVLP